MGQRKGAIDSACSGTSASRPQRSLALNAPRDDKQLGKASRFSKDLASQLKGSYFETVVERSTVWSVDADDRPVGSLAK